MRKDRAHERLQSCDRATRCTVMPGGLLTGFSMSASSKMMSNAMSSATATPSTRRRHLDRHALTGFESQRRFARWPATVTLPSSISFGTRAR